MAANTIQDLLTLTVDQLVAVTDTVTPANDNYLQEKIMGPVKDLAIGLLPAGINYINNSSLGAPFYTNIQTLLNNASPYSGLGTNIDLIVAFEQQPVSTSDYTVTQNRSNTLIYSPNRNSYIVKISLNPISDSLNGMYFRDITVLFTQTSKIDSCVFENCLIKVVGNGSIDFSQSFMRNSIISNIDELNVSKNSEISNCIMKNGHIVLGDNTSKIYGCYLNQDIENPQNNQTPEFNIILSNL